MSFFSLYIIAWASSLLLNVNNNNNNNNNMFLWSCTGEVKADGTMALVKSARSIVFFDTGLPIDKAFILQGLKTVYKTMHI